MVKRYIPLQELEIYRIARETSRAAWKIYKKIDASSRYLIGNQFVRSAGSNGANIAEGYDRLHYLDRIKFMYNARGSLIESIHWVQVLAERKLTDAILVAEYEKLANIELEKLQHFINSIYRSKGS